MKKFFKSRVFAFVFMAFVLVASTAQITAAVVTKDVPSTEDVVNESVSSLKVQVKTLNGSYLKDAKVTVIETGKSYYTDKYGYTPVMQVPFNENALTNTFEGDFAFITIVVSKSAPDGGAKRLVWCAEGTYSLIGRGSRAARPRRGGPPARRARTW